jgi:hypothetical protein
VNVLVGVMCIYGARLRVQRIELKLLTSATILIIVLCTDKVLDWVESIERVEE